MINLISKPRCSNLFPSLSFLTPSWHRLGTLLGKNL